MLFGAPVCTQYVHIHYKTIDNSLMSATMVIYLYLSYAQVFSNCHSNDDVKFFYRCVTNHQESLESPSSWISSLTYLEKGVGKISVVESFVTVTVETPWRRVSLISGQPPRGRICRQPPEKTTALPPK